MDSGTHCPIFQKGKISGVGRGQRPREGTLTSTPGGVERLSFVRPSSLCPSANVPGGLWARGAYGPGSPSARRPISQGGLQARGLMGQVSHCHRDTLSFLKFFSLFFDQPIQYRSTVSMKMKCVSMTMKCVSMTMIFISALWFFPFIFIVSVKMF